MHWHVFGVASLAACAVAPSIAAGGVAAVVVEVPVAHATAEDVESQVTAPLERALVALPGVKQVMSSSIESRSRLEVRYGHRPSEAEVAQVRASAERLARSLPPTASVPRVTVQKGD